MKYQSNYKCLRSCYSLKNTYLLIIYHYLLKRFNYLYNILSLAFQWGVYFTEVLYLSTFTRVKFNKIKGFIYFNLHSSPLYPGAMIYSFPE